MIVLSGERSLSVWNVSGLQPVMLNVFKVPDNLLSFATYGNDAFLCGSSKIGSIPLDNLQVDNAYRVELTRVLLNTKAAGILNIDILPQHRILITGAEDGNVRLCI